MFRLLRQQQKHAYAVCVELDYIRFYNFWKAVGTDTVLCVLKKVKKMLKQLLFLNDVSCVITWNNGNKTPYGISSRYEFYDQCFILRPIYTRRVSRTYTIIECGISFRESQGGCLQYDQNSNDVFDDTGRIFLFWPLPTKTNLHEKSFSNQEFINPWYSRKPLRVNVTYDCRDCRTSWKAIPFEKTARKGLDGEHFSYLGFEKLRLTR